MKIEMGVKMVKEYYIVGVCCESMQKALAENMFHIKPITGMFHDVFEQVLNNCPYCGEKLKGILD